jgi:hypothetical protein
MRDFLSDFDARLARAREEAIRAKREAVLLIRRPVRPGEEPGSYIGGLPCLPEHLEWPVSTKTGLPFSFVAQIDLRDVPRPAGVLFPAEGRLWFFADFSDDFYKDRDTRVLFDPHPRSIAKEREAPPDLPTLHQYGHGWEEAQHPRAFVEPKAALFLHRFDTFHDRPYERRAETWADFARALLKGKVPRRSDVESDDSGLVGSVAYMEMIEQLREDAVYRATGARRTRKGYWLTARSGFGEAGWPATSIDAEYALMTLRGNYRLSTTLRDHPCPPDVVTALAARVQEQIEFLRGLTPRPLTPAERIAVKSIINEVRRAFSRFDVRRNGVPARRFREVVRQSHSDVRAAVNHSYAYTAFEILRRMPEPEQYVPSELLDPYQEWTLGHQWNFHQMFGHASSPQSAPQTAEAEGYVLLLQIGGSETLGFPLSNDAAMHYWIPKRDLARGRFDRVEATWESG